VNIHRAELQERLTEQIVNHHHSDRDRASAEKWASAVLDALADGQYMLAEGIVDALLTCKLDQDRAETVIASLQATEAVFAKVGGHTAVVEALQDAAGIYDSAAEIIWKMNGEEIKCIER
jgi:hypothetical protein